MATILVTGATGMVGSNLVRELVHRGQEVVALLRNSSSHPFLNGLRLRHALGDILDCDSLGRAVAGVEELYHVAGKVSYRRSDRQEVVRVNVEGTRNVLEAALRAGVKKLVLTSSTSAIGLPRPGEVADEAALFPSAYARVAYAASKRDAERLAFSYLPRGLHVVAVCPATVYGGGDIKGNMAELPKAIVAGRIPFAPPGGCAVVSVADCVRGHLLAMEKGRAGERYILSNENLRTIELLNLMAALLGASPVRWTLPRVAVPPLKAVAWVAETLFRTRRFGPDLVTISAMDRFYNSAKARRELGWLPQQSIEAALQEACQFYRESRLL